MAAVMPLQKPGRSKQNYRTPQAFLRAAEHKLGITAFAIDLAADDENAVCDLYYTQAENALARDWNPQYGDRRLGGWGFCNMEFGDIAPWVEKAYQETHRPYDEAAQSALLVPAGVGSNWWRDWVHEKAVVLLLNGRLTFVGQPTCYPKDCCLLLYAQGFRPLRPWYDVWSWPQELSASAAQSDGSRPVATRAAPPPG